MIKQAIIFFNPLQSEMRRIDGEQTPLKVHGISNTIEFFIHDY